MQVGKYQLVRKLASGGMAEVFLAKAAGPMGFEKTLVLKRILPHLAEDPAFVEMFLGEARLAAQLEHPNIVQIFDFGEADGSYFLAMEFIDGPTLRRLVKRALEQPLPPVVCAKLVAQAAEGLAFAHEFSDAVTGEPLGLIHRDVSPDNILVSRQGAVKVVDFGVAKVAGQGHRTQTGVVKGKVAYMPPEQLRASPLDRRVDVYALGVVLYELLTGKRPFEATTEASTMQAILFEPFVPVEARRPDVPEPLRRILELALMKDRDARYPDCRALEADLERYLRSSSEPVGAYQLSQFVAKVMAEAGGTPAAGVVAPVGMTPPKPASAPRSMSAPVEERPVKTTPLPVTVDSTSPTTPMPLSVRGVMGGEVPQVRPVSAEAREKEGARKRVSARHALPAQAGVAGQVRGADDGWKAASLAGAAEVAQGAEVERDANDRVRTDAGASDEDHISTGVQVSAPMGQGRGWLLGVMAAAVVLVVGGGLVLATREESPKFVNPPPLPVTAKREPVREGVAPVAKSPEVAAPVETPPSAAQAPVAQPSVAPVENPVEVVKGSGAEAKPSGVEQAGGASAARAPVVPVPAAQDASARQGAASPTAQKPSQIPVFEAKPEAKPSARAKPPARVGKGTLEFRIRPYAVVTLNDQELGPTPFAPKEVPAGKHRIKLHNPDLHKTQQVTVEVGAGETKVIKYNFEAE
ncbi:protein kinase [Myxococcus sp. K38C18041901]|uniref:serine/threonine protein kinase n=1 Tax=Myxococcus guangdongensis TaxID=2906760 RepID=UPI0020A803CD|nr:protein kinase [Myxococcus guangdongensis]MCP3060651.1 protein kinase [Myxococcus guangdongensis]